MKARVIKILFVIFHPFAQKLPVGGFAPNLAQLNGSPTYDNFCDNFLTIGRGVDSVVRGGSRYWV